MIAKVLYIKCAYVKHINNRKSSINQVVPLKVKVTISIEKEIFEQARKIGLNISRVTENALMDLISKIEQENPQKKINHQIE